MVYKPKELISARFFQIYLCVVVVGLFVFRCPDIFSFSKSLLRDPTKEVLPPFLEETDSSFHCVSEVKLFSNVYLRGDFNPSHSPGAAIKYYASVQLPCAIIEVKLPRTQCLP